MRWIVLSFILIFSFNSQATEKVEQQVYAFDLGKTLVDHGEFKPQKKIFEKGLWYREGAYEYLRKLHQCGHKIMMVINVPESVGNSYAEKMQFLFNLVNLSWNDKQHPEGFAWDLFSSIILPKDDSERKKKGNLAIYYKTLAAAEKVTGKSIKGHQVTFIGEDATEIREAYLAGMKFWQVEAKGTPTFPPFSCSPRLAFGSEK